MPERTIHLHYRIFPEDSLWVGECIELGVSTSAATEAEAREAIDEATRLYLDTLADEGELERVLGERGIVVGSDGTPGAGTIEERTLPLPTAAP